MTNNEQKNKMLKITQIILTVQYMTEVSPLRVFFPLDLEQTDAGSAKRSDSPFCLLSLPFSSLFVAHLALWLMVVVKSMGGHKIKPILESFSQLIQSKIYRVLNICSPNPPDLPT